MESEILRLPHKIDCRTIAQFEQALEIAAISRTKHFPREPQFRARKKCDRKHARDGEEREKRELPPQNVSIGFVFLVLCHLPIISYGSAMKTPLLHEAVCQP